jgi:hypothetical protein
VKINLVGFSEFMSVDNPRDVSMFLVFHDETGRELRLPVNQEAMTAFLKFTYPKGDAPTQPPVSEPQKVVEEDEMEEEFDENEEAEEFGGDVTSGVTFPEVPDDTPSSEEDIPSL